MTDRFDLLAEQLLQDFDNSTRSASRVMLANALRTEAIKAWEQRGAKEAKKRIVKRRRPVL